MNKHRRNKIAKLKQLNFATRQKFHFDKKRAEEYEKAHDYRAKTFNWMVKTIHPYLIHTKSALDVGTGTGDLVRAIKINGIYTGIDISKDMLTVARKNCAYGNFMVGNAYSLPFENEKFEAITYKYALHHLNKPLDSLIEAYRVLKEDGIIFIADVASFENEAHHLIFKKLNRLREPANYEYRTIKTITGLVRRAGFRNIKVIKKDFNLVLEDWLSYFYEPKKTTCLVLNSSTSFRKAVKLKTIADQKHQITLTSFVIKAKK